MNKFRHHPDGYIFINDLSLTINEWLELEPEYTLPEGFTGSEYQQGVEHRVFNSKKEEILGKEWEEGDKYINNIENYRKKLIKKDEKENPNTKESPLFGNREKKDS